jgi:hypothetical protein
MSPALRYFPAYLGLFAAQVLALACNAFLDIQYGGFSTEVMLWAFMFAITLRVGWRQNGETSETGARWMRRTLIFGALVTVLLFIPMWGFPRAGLYMLAMLQVSYNCVTTTRRHLHLSLLISVVMVLFAASHYRADWTMLFYLVPYVTAVVFTLVAEQINRKAGELRQQSLGNQVVGAQGAAILAATTVILALGLVLYAVTPQVTWTSLMWRWGQPADIAAGDGSTTIGKGGIQTGQDGGGAAGKGDSGAGEAGSGWPSPEEMRKAAGRKGMPEWQRGTINGMADLTESLGEAMQPIMRSCVDLWELFKEWLREHRDELINALIILSALALLYAFWRLMKEAKVGIWVRTRFDYLRYVLLGMQRDGEQGARDYYEAMVRLFELHDVEHSDRNNTREHLARMNAFYRHLSHETGEMTRLFEDARYGGQVSANQVGRMRELYRRLYQRIGEI